MLSLFSLPVPFHCVQPRRGRTGVLDDDPNEPAEKRAGHGAIYWLGVCNMKLEMLV